MLPNDCHALILFIFSQHTQICTYQWACVPAFARGSIAAVVFVQNVSTVKASVSWMIVSVWMKICAYTWADWNCIESTSIWCPGVSVSVDKYNTNTDIYIYIYIYTYMEKRLFYNVGFQFGLELFEVRFRGHAPHWQSLWMQTDCEVKWEGF